MNLMLAIRVSPPGCATSRLHPATHITTALAMLTPSTEYHRNRVVWIKPTKLVAVAPTPWKIDELFEAGHLHVQPQLYQH